MNLLEGLIVVIILQLIIIWHTHMYTNSSITYQRGRRAVTAREPNDSASSADPVADSESAASPDQYDDPHAANRIPVDYVPDAQLTSATTINDPKFNSSRFANNQPGNYIQDGQIRPIVFG